MNKEEVKKIANLARIDINDSELEKVTQKIDSVLNYVDMIKQASTEKDNRIENAVNYNVMRDDIAVEKTGMHTDVIIKESPESQDNLIKVKKILSNSDN